MFEQNLQHRILCGKNKLRISHGFWFGKEIELKNYKQNNVVKGKNHLVINCVEECHYVSNKTTFPSFSKSIGLEGQ